MATTTLKIKADPRKSFFIDMLTRDISLIDCIFDLIDNSIDSILHRTKFDPMKGLTREEKIKLNKYKISINFTKNSFFIEDNSVGIEDEIVTTKVFRFGAENSSQKKLGLSVYGIGMKRAFFKIGKLVDFESTSKKGTVSVQFNVDNWVKDENSWDLEGSSTKDNNKKLGTRISIKNITEEVAPNFKNQAFETRLIEKIQTTYGIFLDYGLVINVNNKKTEAKLPTIMESKAVKVSSKIFKKDNVSVKIIAGLSSKDDKKSNGWFIFCNGRMILEGDKTENTGWGNGMLRKFHASTNRFVGFVYFKSDNVNLLPWTTTKNGVNYESTIYQYALSQMVTIAKPIVNFLVGLYNKNKGMGGVDKILEDGKETTISNITKGNSLFSVDMTSLANKKGQEEIIYFVPNKDIGRIKKVMEDDHLSNSEIGKKSFYYYLEHEE